MALHILLLLLSLGCLSLSGSADAVTPDMEKHGAVIASDSLPARNFVRLYGGLDNFFHRVKSEKEAHVAFLGGSITAGNGWRNKITEYLEQQYPDTRWTFLNAGVPSLGSLPHAFRLETDVLEGSRIDLLFVESAVNDFVNGTPLITQYRCLEGIIRHARREQPSMDIVLMAFADESKVADYAADRIPREVKVHDDIAKHYHLPFINLAEEVSARITAKEFTWKDDFINLHPSPFGHQIYFRTIRTMLTMCERKSRSRGGDVLLPSPWDALNYSHGRYAPVADAEIINDFHLQPLWSPKDHAKTRNGFVAIPVLVGEQPGGNIEFAFRGSAVGLAIVSGPDAGVIRYSVDGEEPKELDLFTEWSGSLHLPWFLLLKDGLGHGTHTLRVTLTEKHHPRSKGTACRIVHFLVNGPL